MVYPAYSGKITERGAGCSSRWKQFGTWFHHRRQPATGTFWRIKFQKNVSHCRKKLERDPLVSPGIICYAEEMEHSFWFTSPARKVQIDTIKFGRTFRNYIGQFLWIEIKRVTIIVAFHFMKRRLKTEQI